MIRTPTILEILAFLGHKIDKRHSLFIGYLGAMNIITIIIDLTSIVLLLIMIMMIRDTAYSSRLAFCYFVILSSI